MINASNKFDLPVPFWPSTTVVKGRSPKSIEKLLRRFLNSPISSLRNFIDQLSLYTRNPQSPKWLWRRDDTHPLRPDATCPNGCGDPLQLVRFIAPSSPNIAPSHHRASARPHPPHQPLPLPLQLPTFVGTFHDKSGRHTHVGWYTYAGRYDAFASRPYTSHNVFRCSTCCFDCSLTASSLSSYCSSSCSSACSTTSL